MIWVEPGTFTMGSDSSESGHDANEAPQHQVTLTKGFYLGKYEVTQQQYLAVTNSNPSHFADDPNLPVEMLSQVEAIAFANQVTNIARSNGTLPGGWMYDLPTESEWEYACRAGTTTSRYWGDSVDPAYANYFGNGINRTVPVGQYPPNQWGFHDMLGNVWEWTLGAQGGYPSGSVIDPVDSTSGYANNRGNSWKQGAGYLRSAKRGLWTYPNHSTYPTSGMNEVGFRLSFRQLSLPPTNLNSTTVLTIAENQPTGTIVGEFNATDPEGGAITYHLVSGEGDGNNSLFTLDQNGKLKTAAVLDYEAGSRLSIRVQAKDELNATVEGNFTVTLLDVYEPSRENHTVELNATVGLGNDLGGTGYFYHGSPNGSGRMHEPEHNVTLTQGFYLGKYEVTQAQYEAVMTGNTDGLSATPSNWPNNPDRPVEKVSWDDIQKFLTRLNAQEAGNIPAGWAYVLPTEAQWEYACRAGTTTAYSWGDSITRAMRIISDSGTQTADVGLYSANPWGFFDMHGNVWEWTADWYAAYSSGAQTDPEGPATGSTVSIGAAPGHTGTYLRSAYRTHAPQLPQLTSASVSVSKSSQTRPAPNWNCSGVPISRTSATSHGRSPATERAMCGTAT